MSLWTLIRIVAGLVVAAAVVFTALLVRHVRHEPLGGIFGELVPVTFEAKPLVSLPQPNADLPEIDLGAKVFEKARELIALGDLGGARDRLRTVVSIYPRSKAAPEARWIVGEMNLDDLLSGASMEGKEVYKVKRGDSFLAIASRHRTSLDMIMHLNGLMDLNSLHPGDELVVMPQDFRLLIDPGRDALSVWDGGRFLKEYPILESKGAPSSDVKTTIAGKVGLAGERRLSPGMPEYPGAPKQLSLTRPPLVIGVLGGAADGELGDGEEAAEMAANGFYLAAEDLEELSLLIRPGNEVEIRPTAR